MGVDLGSVILREEGGRFHIANVYSQQERCERYNQCAPNHKGYSPLCDTREGHKRCNPLAEGINRSPS